MTNFVVGSPNASYKSWTSLPVFEGELAANGKVYKINIIKTRTYVGADYVLRLSLFIAALVATLGLAMAIPSIRNLKNSINIVHFVSEIKANSSQPKTPLYIVASSRFKTREVVYLKKFFPKSRFERQLIIPDIESTQTPSSRLTELLGNVTSTTPKPLVAVVLRACSGNHIFGPEGEYDAELGRELKSLTQTGQIHTNAYFISENSKLLPQRVSKRLFYNVNTINAETGINRNLSRGVSI